MKIAKIMIIALVTMFTFSAAEAQVRTRAHMESRPQVRREAMARRPYSRREEMSRRPVYRHEAIARRHEYRHYR